VSIELRSKSVVVNCVRSGSRSDTIHVFMSTRGYLQKEAKPWEIAVYITVAIETSRSLC
jgi:hypothetical protein